MATYGKLFNINSIMTPDDNGHQRKNRLQHPYRPLQTDVLCGRGKKFINHEGNKTLRALVKQLSPQYNELDRKGKRLLQIDIYIYIYTKTTSTGNFIILKGNHWVNLSKELAIKKLHSTSARFVQECVTSVPHLNVPQLNLQTLSRLIPTS